MLIFILDTIYNLLEFTKKYKITNILSTVYKMGIPKFLNYLKKSYNSRNWIIDKKNLDTNFSVFEINIQK